MAANAATPPSTPHVNTDLIRVDDCRPEQAAEWDQLIADQPGGCFYHLYGWRRINDQALGASSTYLAAHDHDGRLCGALPLALISSRLFGRILCSMPFVNYGGPCARTQQASTALIEAARARADELRADYLELRCAQELATDLVASTRKVSMQIELAADPDALWNKFASKHRTNIRRSAKNGLEVRSGGAEMLPVFYALMEESWRNLGTPFYSRRYFAGILEAFPEHTRIFVCYRGAEPIATAFNGYFNGVVEGMWAGGSAAARALQANYVLYWEMMRDACVRGFRTYHLGRSTADSGAEDFKRKWNAVSSPLYWYFYRPGGGAMPQLNVDNPKYRLAISLWRRMPLWATRVLGPPLARLIP